MPQGNSCPKAIHARQGNSLAIGRHAAPTVGSGMVGIRKGTSRAPSPTVGERTFFVCFQSSRRDTFMRHGAIHGETNSCPKAIHARQGNSLAIGRHAAPGRVLSEILGNAWISAGQSHRVCSAPMPPLVRGGGFLSGQKAGGVVKHFRFLTWLPAGGGMAADGQ